MTHADSSLTSEAAGTEITRFNALKHGILSRYTVLPWESVEEYRALVAALAAEHCPQGPTEEHLVEELAGILWRKRRLRLAEAALHRRGLEGTLAPWRETVKEALVHLVTSDRSERVVDAIRATSEESTEEIRDLNEDEGMTRTALELLGSSNKNAYEDAIAALRADTREWWEDILNSDPGELDENEEPPTADADSLRHFLERTIVPWYATRREEIANRTLIREQAFGDAVNAEKLERLGRYEAHLDRKLERTLTMLLRLKDLRASARPD